MKQLYRIITVFLLAIFWADVAYAQYEVAIEDELLQDTCLSYLTGLWYYNLGDEEFKEPSHDIASKMYFEMAVRSFEQHEKEHPQHDYTNLFLGQSYYYLTLLESHITTGVPEYNKKVNEYAQNALQHLPQDNTIMRFICYAISGLCFVDEQNDHDASNAFQEALNYNLDFSSNPILLYFYKWSLYQHSYLCYSSYLNNISYSINKCGSIQETPTLDTCSGDQQLEHCIDGLNRLVGIEQNESDRNQIDTSALVLLGECYYYKGEYEQAKRCYEKLGNLLLYDEIKNRDNFVNHFNQGILLYYGDSLNGVEPDTCIAFQEFEKAIECDVNYKKHPAFIPYYKNVLFQHAAILFDSYRFNIPDTTNNCDPIKEIPEWATCVGDHQLDRCIDDLNHIVTLDQAESEINSIDTTALALLGECHYYKKEYKKATDCFEQSGLTPERLYALRGHEAARFFLDSYIKQEKDTCELASSLTYTLIESYRNNYDIYHQLYRDVADYKLYIDNPNDEDANSSWLRSAHDFLLYYYYLGESEKALDFWLKIKNNFSLSPMLLMDQALIRIDLGDFNAISDFAYAFNMMNQDGSLNDFLVTSSNKHTNDDEDDVFKTIKDAYFNFAISSFYIDSNYVEAKKYYRDCKMPEDILMMGICYNELAKKESDPKTKTDYETLSRKKFREVIFKEDSIGKFLNTPYAYLYLGKVDKAVEAMECILKTDFPSSTVTIDDGIKYHSLHYEAAEIYAQVGDIYKAKRHLDKAFAYCHEPILLAFALKMPLLGPIRDYVEEEVYRYKVSLGIAEPRIIDTIITCDIPFAKHKKDYTKTVKCRINDYKDETEMLFDPGADKCLLNIDDANTIGITCNDIIGYVPCNLANGKDVVKPLVSLKNVEIGDIELENVQAVIDSTANAKSLLGCTVWNNLKVEMPSPVNKGMIRLTYIKESIEIPEDKKNTDKKQSE